MSVTFTPAAGCSTTYEYYDGTGDPLDENTQNGILRFSYDFPSVNYANSRAAHVMGILDFGSVILHEDGTRERVLYGTIPAHRCKTLLQKLFELQLTEDLWDEYKLHQFVQVLRHCQFHNCDLHYT